MPKEVWILESDGNIYTEKPSIGPVIKRAFLDGDNLITVALTHEVDEDSLSMLMPYLEIANAQRIEGTDITLIGTKTSKVVQISLPEKISFDQFPLRIFLNGFGDKNVELRHFLDDERFYTNELPGVFYTPSVTTFKVYAPAAQTVQINIYPDPMGGEPEKFELTQKNNIWSVQISRDLKGLYYTYTIQNFGQEKIINPDLIDPYAKAVTKYNGRGIIVDDQTPVADRPDFSIDKAIIYEMHVRDFSISDDSGMKHKGKYLAFTEENTKIPGTDISTGLDHLTELGINTIQLLPIQDFEFDEKKSEYFWGYMPVNFDAPNGWYATKRTDASPVREFKELVDALHKKGIKVVMDVVYNHTSEGSPLIQYNFNGFIPNFYYRQHPDGSYWNGSGCGNEMRSEQPMVRKYIIESLKYWTTEYKVDGFRFDLMGLHDFETVRDIVKMLKAIDPNIFIYGEPWTAGNTPIDPTVKGKQKGEGFSVFNDNFRDAIKGPWYNTDPGYIQTGIGADKIKIGIEGSIDDFAKYPYESINYVAVHDGRTFWDQLNASTIDSNFTRDELVAMDKLAAAILFTSQGVPFIHGGQEMLRTKFDSHNSYNQPDEINNIRWNWKKDNMDVFKYYQGLIELRKKHPIFRKTDPNDIRQNIQFLDYIGSYSPKTTVSYVIRSGKSDDNWNKVLVFINPNHVATKFRVIAGDWNVVVDNKNAGIETLYQINVKNIELPPISCFVMWQ
jgi:pullulanase